jgi:hypothetical protein
MAISDLIEKIGRTIFEAPFGAMQISKDAPELAEIRLAVLDEVKSKSHRVSGKDVFPYNLVRIHIRGVPKPQAAAFEGEFFTRFFEDEVKGGLQRANCRFPDDLSLEVITVPDLPGPGEQWLSVETASNAKPAQAAPPRRAARLSVLKGTANQPEIVLNKARTNIGRTVDVYRTNGPSRRNDLAFIGEGEISRTVSREHAHIAFLKKAGEYRLFNDRSGNNEGNCGLWIIRNGMSQEVHRDARGVRLEPGDEIHLGRAIVRFRA